MDATTIKIQRLMPICDLCNKSVSGHCYAKLASAIISDDLFPRMREFLESVKQHAWQQVITFNDWDSQRDALLAYIIIGPHQEGLIIVMNDPYELYVSEELVLVETVTMDEINAISSVVAFQWKDL